MLRAVGAVAVLIGAFMVLMNLRQGMYSILSIQMLIGLVILYVGSQLARGRALGSSPFGLPSATSQNYPAGFQPTHAHKNIAIDATAGTVWLRDQGTAVIPKSDILSVQAMSDSSNHQTNIGPRTVHLHCRLIVRTRSVDRPVWTIPFDQHMGRSVSGGRMNFDEAQAWEGRLLAFMSTP